MGQLPIAQWQDALERMDLALVAATRALDRREERLDRAVAPSAGEGELPTLERIDTRLEEWESRLRAADELTASVERELADRASSVARWLERFAAWEELLEREHVAS